MAIPFPPGGISGASSPGQVARELLSHFVWMARWSDEIGSDAQLDLKKLAQLAFVHCRAWDAATVNADVIKAFQVFAQIEQGIEWPDRATMTTELSGLRSAATALFEHVRDNVPEARSFATRVLDETGRETDTPNVVDKSTQTTAVNLAAALRALYA